MYSCLEGEGGFIARDRKPAGEEQDNDQQPGGEGPCKKGFGSIRKMDNTLKAILKRQVLKYNMMTAIELQTSLATLWVVSE